MTDREKLERHRKSARESARRKNGYYTRKHKNKNTRMPVFDLCDFDVWYELNFLRGQNVKPPKTISFKEHIQILVERDNQYSALLNEYNLLVDKYYELLEKDEK